MTSVWNPGPANELTVNAATTLVPQVFAAASVGQTLFTLTDFTYALSTNSLLVFIDGVLTYDFTETSTSSFTLTTPLAGGEIVTAMGFVGISGVEVMFTAALLAASNLSDLANVATARANLGLGTAALISSTAGGDLSGTLPSPTILSTYINSLGTVTPATGDYVAIVDVSDANASKKALLSAILALAAGSAVSGVTLDNTNRTIDISTDNGKIIKCDTASVNYTVPTAVGQTGRSFFVWNATSTDTAVKLTPTAAESLGGATGTTIYVPSYTIIGFTSDDVNWIVFQYSGKRTFQFSASGTMNPPPWFAASIPALVDAIGGGGGAYTTGSTATAGGATSLGALLTVTAGPSAATAPSLDFGTGGATAGSHRAGIPANTSGIVMSGAHPRFGTPHIARASDTSLPFTGTGYGIGGLTSRAFTDYAGVVGSAGWCIGAPVTLVPGVPQTVTIGAAGANEGGYAINAAPTAGFLELRI